MRATHFRVSRNDCRAPLRNQLVRAKKSGITAKVTRARRQSRATMTAMIPRSVKRSPRR